VSAHPGSPGQNPQGVFQFARLTVVSECSSETDTVISDITVDT